MWTCTVLYSNYNVLLTLLLITETVMGLMYKSVFPGQSCSWGCQVPSTIPLQFTWYLNDDLINDTSTVSSSHMDNMASSTYTLNNVSYDNNSSTVRCSAAGSSLMVNSSVVSLTGKSLYLMFKS